MTQFYLQSTCTQFAINLLFVTLQLEVAFKLLAICNPLLFAYNFNWHSNCLQFTINLLFCKTTSTGIQIACNLQSVALCLQLQLAYQLPAICTPLLFAYNFQRYSKARNLQPVCSLPATTTSLQMPAIRNSFACCLQLLLVFKLPANLQSVCSLPTTTISRLDSRTCICFVHNASERYSDISQIICEPSHATNCILSARHALILMVSQYSDPVQAFENVIF